jgi:hypothetical protein
MDFPLSSTLGGSNILTVNPSNGCLFDRNKERKNLAWVSANQGAVSARFSGGQYFLNMFSSKASKSLFNNQYKGIKP